MLEYQSFSFVFICELGRVDFVIETTIIFINDNLIILSSNNYGTNFLK
ncbi:hypothetical protein SAMN04488097_1040 [Epilithonimonas lactis]|nr:hypothetical protein SAMN04488097_1040 [Epilithonimonas lactis]